MILCLTSVSAHGTPSCDGLFAPTNGEARLAHKVAARLSASPEILKKFGASSRGYIIISAAMVTSAALSAKLTHALPKDMEFLSNLVGQVSTIGIFVLGAPIWEPISSAFRKYAFGLKRSDTAAPAASDPALEVIWQRTQSQYSLNSQMSRNVVQAFLLAAHANFTSARIAMLEGDRKLAVAQVAEMAVRMRRLFAEIDPLDPSVRLAVQSTFARHIIDSHEILDDVITQIKNDDPEFRNASVEAYYQALLSCWLKR